MILSNIWHLDEYQLCPVGKTFDKEQTNVDSLPVVVPHKVSCTVMVSGMLFAGATQQ